MSGLTISDLREDEIPAAVALWNACCLTRPWNDPLDDARLALAGPSSTILAGRIDGVVVATAMVGWDGHRGAVYYLAVDPARRGGGHGQAIMAAAEAWLARFNAPKLNLMVRTDNAAVHGFYDSLNYSRDDVVVRSKRLRP
jgi:ribosomal protein S18 acetylase RimI-like enzyme